MARAAVVLGANADLASIGYVLEPCSYLPLLAFSPSSCRRWSGTRRL